MWLKVSEDPELEAALDESEEVQAAVLDVVHNGEPDKYAGNPGVAFDSHKGIRFSRRLHLRPDGVVHLHEREHVVVPSLRELCCLTLWLSQHWVHGSLCHG